jgi:hypothetical protein
VGGCYNKTLINLNKNETITLPKLHLLENLVLDLVKFEHH